MLNPYQGTRIWKKIARLCGRKLSFGLEKNFRALEN